MNRFTRVPATAALLLAACGASCTTADRTPTDAPATPAVAWESELNAPMRDVITELTNLGPKPLSTLTPAEARKQPSAADAAMAVMRKKGIPGPEPVGNVADRQIPGPAGSLQVRVYTPQGTGPFPAALYIHGGGWVIATLDTYDSSARALCNAAKAVVVSIEYRKGPEDKFPAAHEDAFAAWKWLTQNAAQVGGDPSHVDVAGESAGGNMAIAVALMARDRKAPLPKHVVSVYPVAQLGGSTPSIEKYATAKPLDKPALAWFGGHYMKSPADANNPILGILNNADLKELPPTTIIGAQVDPLQSEGKMLADKMKAAGVDVRYRLFAGVTHEFFGMGAVVPDAKEAVRFAAEGLK